jgi:hypothetical protein
LGFFFEGELPLSLELAVANALAPLMTVKFFIDQQLVQHDLSDLRWKTLTIMGLVYAALNSAMNQLVLYWNRVIHDLIDGLQIMFTGDITGVVLVMVLMQLAIWVVKRKKVAAKDHHLPPGP